MKKNNDKESKYLVDAAMSSGILKAKQKLGVTYNSDKLGGIDFTKFSKLSMCSAGVVSFEIFVKAMPPSLSELKVLPSFCFAFKIPDDMAASTT